jgi:hypothetical protein
VLLEHSQRDSHYLRSLFGESADWSVTDQLLALIADLLAAANWQRGGGKGTRPKPLPRPGAAEEGRRFGGGTVMSLQDARNHFKRGGE